MWKEHFDNITCTMTPHIIILKYYRNTDAATYWNMWKEVCTVTLMWILRVWLFSWNYSCIAIYMHSVYTWYTCTWYNGFMCGISHDNQYNVTFDNQENTQIQSSEKRMLFINGWMWKNIRNTYCTHNRALSMLLWSCKKYIYCTLGYQTLRNSLATGLLMLLVYMYVYQIHAFHFHDFHDSNPLELFKY